MLLLGHQFMFFVKTKVYTVLGHWTLLHKQVWGPPALCTEAKMLETQKCCVPLPTEELPPTSLLDVAYFRSCWLVTWRWSLPTDAAYKSNSDPTWEKCCPQNCSVIEDNILKALVFYIKKNTFCNLLATAMVADRISSFPSQLCAPPLWKHWGDQLHGTKLSPARGNAYKVTKGKCEIMWAPPGKCPKHLRRKSLSFFPREN